MPAVTATRQRDLGFAPPPIPPRAGARPFLRWAGGKSWAVPYLAPGIHARLSATGGRYVEPFLGGGAIALDLGLPDMILGERIAPIAAAWRAVRDRPEQVSARILEIARAYGVDASGYAIVRGILRACPDRDDLTIGATAIYLNDLCFNGLWRENARGEMNVPYGDVISGDPAVEASWPFSSADDLRVAACALVGSPPVRCQDFRPTIEEARAGDVVLADPPYWQGFTGYAAGGFSEVDQRDLAGALRRAADRGAAVLAFNHDEIETRAWYAWATLVSTAERRAINSDGGGRGRRRCVIFASDPSIIGSGES